MISCEILDTFREHLTLNWEYLTGNKKMYLLHKITTIFYFKGHLNSHI